MPRHDRSIADYQSMRDDVRISAVAEEAKSAGRRTAAEIAYVPGGSLVSTTVQAAISELAAAAGGDMRAANNLSELPSKPTARVNLGLGNVDNTSDANKPISTVQQAALDLKANLVSPALTGNPTTPNQASGNNSTRIANTAYVDAAVAALIASAPGLLDTLDEIAAALGDDPNFAATITTAIGLKLAKASNLSDLANAGTARSNLGIGNVDNTADSAKPVSIAQQSALDLKANLASPTFTGTVGGISKGMVGLGSVDNTSDAGKPVSTAQQAALDLKANLAAPTFTGDAKAVTPSAGDNDTSIATTAFVQQAVPNSSYRTILDCTGSHTAARVAGTYWLGQGSAAGITGTGTLYSPNLIYIDSADYPSVDGKAPKLRIRIQVYCNDVAPFTGTFIFGLYPVTRPGTSGGAGLCIYTMGSVVAGSQVTLTNPAADSSNNLVTADFALPANGHYVIGFVTNQSMAASSHVHISAILQLRNA